jgi:hypothetical protein
MINRNKILFIGEAGLTNPVYPRSVSVEQIGGIFLGKTDRLPTFVY